MVIVGMKCTAHDLEVMGLSLDQVELLRYVVLLSWT